MSRVADGVSPFCAGRDVGLRSAGLRPCRSKSAFDMSTSAASLHDVGLELDVECGPAGCALVAVRGELDLFTGPALRQGLGELIASGRTLITLDLSQLSFIDSAGHRSLRAVADLAESAGGDLRLDGCSAPVSRFLDVTSGILVSAPLPLVAARQDRNLGSDRPRRAVGF
jgi:anti-sigma B factor antagonist